jgi:hypothetical protein
MSKRRGRPRSNTAEHRMATMLDQLAEFEQFKDDVLPLLRQAIKEGWSREQIDNHPQVQALLAARQITIALRELDSSKALAAIKDLRDRTQGRPTEKVETTHKLEKLPEEQLDSLLISKLKEVELAEEDDDSLPH